MIKNNEPSNIEQYSAEDDCFDEDNDLENLFNVSSTQPEELKHNWIRNKLENLLEEKRLRREFGDDYDFNFDE